jgi:hypothetical protein
MKMAMSLDYKPTRYEGKGFLWNLNIRIHRGESLLLRYKRPAFVIMSNTISKN